MSTQKINENFTFGFTSRDSNTNDTLLDVDVRFENPKDDSSIIQKINIWLQAIGRTNIVVGPKPMKLCPCSPIGSRQ